jgi:hypothetical protein
VATRADSLSRSGAARAPSQPAQAGGQGSVVETGVRRLLIVAGVMLAASVQTLDATITNVALPNIQGDLGASTDEGTWVINGYTIAVVIVIAAMLFVPLTTAVLGGVPLQVGAKASAYVNLGTQLGGSIAIAALSTLVDRRTAFHLAVLAGNVVPGVPAVSRLAAKANPSQLFGIVNGQATILAYADVSLAIAVAAFIAIFLVVVMPKPKTGVVGGTAE